MESIKPQPFPTPFQTRSSDVIFIGRGVLATAASGASTLVPSNVELIVFGPPFSAVSYDLGLALGSKQRVAQLWLTDNHLDEAEPQPVQALRYGPGTRVPNYLLPRHPCLPTTPDAPHLLGAGNTSATLANLWERLQNLHTDGGEPLRCYWVPCMSAVLAPGPVVCHR